MYKPAERDKRADWMALNGEVYTEKAAANRCGDGHRGHCNVFSDQHDAWGTR